MADRTAVRPLAAETVPGAGFTRALGTLAGPWLFATGAMAVDADGRPAPSVAPTAGTFTGRHRYEAEAREALARLSRILSDAGAGFADIVRLDQYYRDWRAVPHYHIARHAALAGTGGVPASTSILEPELLYPEASLQIDMVARTDGATIEIMRPDGLPVSSHMGYAPIVRVGDFIFLSGQMAEDGNDGIAAAARVPATHLWKGSAIRLETDYILREKIVPSLEAAGASPADVAAAHIHIADPEDIPAFNDVWSRWFPEAPPATTIAPTARPGFNCPDASLEITVVAHRPEGPAQRSVVSADGVPTLFPNHSQAVKAGDLLFLSGLVAIGEDGRVDNAATDPLRPWFGDPGHAQTARILDMAQALCATAGTSLANAVRIRQYHTDLSHFQGSVRAWTERLGDRPLPLSAIRVPGPLPVPGATVLIDLWVHAP